MLANLRLKQTLHHIHKLQKKWNSKINVCFLDFDGVFIIPRKSQEAYLERISTLCKIYQLKVVIISSWRFDMDRCIDMLEPYGIEVIGRTTLEGKDRNLQILEYMETHPFHHFVILDDMHLESFPDYAVKCDFYTGFDEKAYEQAIQILERQQTSAQESDL